MALTTLSYKTDADVVKTEGPNRISRDEGILARVLLRTFPSRDLLSGKSPLVALLRRRSRAATPATVS